MHIISYEERITRGFAKIDSDLQILMEALAQVLRESGAADVAEVLPWSTSMQGDSEDENNAEASRLGQAFDQRHAQAYSIAFQLLNLVEESTAAHMRRVVESANGIGHEPALWGRRLQELSQAGWSGREIAEVLPLCRVEPVLTAHPTESKRVTIIQRHRDLYQALSRHSAQEATPSERTQALEEIRTLVELLWRTGEIVLQKPTVDSERAAQLHYFNTVFPQSLRLMDRRLRAAWQTAGLEPSLLANAAALPSLRFGTWVGGDRDGHPLVTAAVTERTLAELRTGALKLLAKELHELRASLSLSDLLQTPPERLSSLISALEACMPTHKARALMERNPHEPWRHAVSLMLRRLPHAEAASETSAQVKPYAGAAELAADLNALRLALEEAGAGRLARERVDPVVRQTNVFGFHLAALDIRQNSTVHERAVEQMLQAAGLVDWQYCSWNESQRRKFLSEQLESPYVLHMPDFPEDTDAGRVLAALRVVADHARAKGTEGLGSLIVSMTRDVSDLLAVFFLARHAGLCTRHEGALACRLPVVPLFETFDDLVRAPAMVSEFLAHPVTRATLAMLAPSPAHTAEGWLPRSLTVMIGYSDSNKDSGMLAGNWALFRSQRDITAAAAAHGVRVRFFHGRGGTISRGAGPTHRFLDALPAGALAFDHRLTEQGETIAQKYANIDTAVYHLESLTAGVSFVSASQLHSTRPPAHPDETLVEAMVEASREAYRALWDAPGFGAFHRQATPIDVLEASRIGSRPARRSGAATLADLRAIPWVFSWSQARFFLTGWYGAGTALEAARGRDGDLSRLARAVEQTPFLRYALANIETSLASAELPLMRDYAALVEDAEIRERILGMIEAEYSRTTTLLGELNSLIKEGKRPRLHYSLRRRRDALRPLHAHQIKLLKQWRAAKEGGRTAEAEAMLPGLLVSVNAIASGLRTTG